MPRNERLIQAREQRGWSQSRAADEIGISRVHYARLEAGTVVPHGTTMGMICDAFKMSAEALGLRKFALGPPTTHQTSTALSLGRSPELIELAGREVGSLPLDWSDPEFRVQCIIYEALSRRISLDEFRWKLANALREESTMMDLDRRKLLRRLALVPIQAFGLSLVGASRPSAPEDLLIHCSAGIAACEHLSRGIDLNLAYSAVSTYVPALKEIARNSPSQRQNASELVAQAMLLLSMLSLHLEGSKSAIGYAQQAVTYSSASGNIELRLTSLGQLAWIYSSDKQYRKALEQAQLAEHLLRNAKDVHPLAQSNTYAVLGAYSAQNGYRDEALTALNLATQAFFSTTPATDFGYMDFDHAELALTWGRAHARTGHPEEALQSFTEVIDATTLAAKMPISERTRIELLNSMALASVKSVNKDLEQTIAYWQAAIQGAKTLQSEQRFGEALTAFEIMEGVWPGERRITGLRELIVHW